MNATRTRTLLLTAFAALALAGCNADDLTSPLGDRDVLDRGDRNIPALEQDETEQIAPVATEADATRNADRPRLTAAVQPDRGTEPLLVLPKVLDV